MKIVTFCGHGKLGGEPVKKIKETVLSEIEKLILNGAEEFLLGGYGDFDIMCAQVLLELKLNYPHICTILVTPYLDRKYNTTLYSFIEYPEIETVTKSVAIVKRNEYMVNRSDVVVAFVKYDFGGAAKTLEYAKRKGKQIINIAYLV